LGRLRQTVDARDDLRWLELGCSLGAGGGDEHSDTDVAIGYVGALSAEEMESLAGAIVEAIDDEPVSVLVHRMEGWPHEVRRVAVGFADDVQLDLVLLPGDSREGVPDRTSVLVDKDERLRTAWTPPSRQPPNESMLHEWTFLGWWALSDAAKYLARTSLFEAVEALGEARKHALQLFAVSRSVPYPAFGLVSLLDFPPFELPPTLVNTYCPPSDFDSVRTATVACADLMDQSSVDACAVLGFNFNPSIGEPTRRRLKALRAPAK
jgi:hypothetical protein